MAKFSAKWRLIRKVLSSDECIIVARKNDEFICENMADGVMFLELFEAIKKYVPRWYGAWLTNSKK